MKLYKHSIGGTILCPKLGANLLRNGIKIDLKRVRSGSFLFLSYVFETCAQQRPGQQLHTQCDYSAVHAVTVDFW
jgi:hypothetical protein